MKINKLYAPWSPQYWSPLFQKRYGMDLYQPHNTQDRLGPVVVFGCYGGGTKMDIMNHEGLCVIVWSGSDSVRLHEKHSFIDFCKANKHRVFHIAHSHWIQTDLKHFGFDVIDRVVVPKDLSMFKYEPHQGTGVYHYGTNDRSWYYGTDLMKKLSTLWAKFDKYPKIHMAIQTTYKPEQLYDIYKDSFIGVRLTEHDNMAMSVLEMGLMGRRSIFNGNVPGAIPYPCVPYITYTPETRRRWVWQDDSLLSVVAEMILHYYDWPTPSRELAEEVLEFVNGPEDWLNTEFHLLA